MSGPARLTRRAVEDNTISCYQTAAGTRPDLRLVELDGRRFVVKDYMRSDRLFRILVSPALVRREFGALRILAGVPGVPDPIARIDRYSFAMELIPGVSVRDLDQGVLDSRFHADLRRVIDDIHSRGVAHCDLRCLGNTMLGDDGKPYLVDFTAAVFRGRGLNPFCRWVFRQFVLADRNAILRVKRRRSPELLTDEEKAELGAPQPLYRPAKIVSGVVRGLVRRLLVSGAPGGR